MMRIDRLYPRVLTLVLAAAALVAMPALAPAQSNSATVNEQAPEFTLPGTDGETYSLSEFEGEWVVLEWLNFGCPYVQKHYNSGNIPDLQETYTDEGVAWLSVVSSAEGTQGYYPPEKMNAVNEQEGGNQTAILMDTDGTVGRTYGAKTTPHMYVINPDGELIYKGGIDDIPTTDPADLPEATNFVRQTLEAAMNGEPVPTQTAPPYGCSVKYSSG